MHELTVVHYQGPDLRHMDVQSDGQIAILRYDLILVACCCGFQTRLGLQQSSCWMSKVVSAVTGLRRPTKIKVWEAKKSRIVAEALITSDGIFTIISQSHWFDISAVDETLLPMLHMVEKLGNKSTLTASQTWYLRDLILLCI